MHKSKLIAILGPTASGKTDTSIFLAKQFNGAIISADSRQIYCGMDIGTGKPIPPSVIPAQAGIQSVQLIQGIPHFLFNIINPDQEFSVAEYKKLALTAINNIIAQGKTPFLVGGTGLYIQAIVDNLEIPEVPPNKELRKQFASELLEIRLLSHGSQTSILKSWYDKLTTLDPTAKIDSRNPRRIIRALEIVMATGKPLSEMRKKGKPLFDTLQIGIDLPRKTLYERIDMRVDAMIAAGLETEVRGLAKKYKNFFDLPAAQSPGYIEWQNYFNGTAPHEKIIKQIKFNTHAYARRQMTWFRKNKKIQWAKTKNDALRLVEEFTQAQLQP